MADEGLENILRVFFVERYESELRKRISSDGNLKDGRKDELQGALGILGMLYMPKHNDYRKLHDRERDEIRNLGIEQKLYDRYERQERDFLDYLKENDKIFDEIKQIGRSRSKQIDENFILREYYKAVKKEFKSKDKFVNHVLKGTRAIRRKIESQYMLSKGEGINVEEFNRARYILFEVLLMYENLILEEAERIYSGEIDDIIPPSSGGYGNYGSSFRDAA